MGWEARAREAAEAEGKPRPVVDVEAPSIRADRAGNIRRQLRKLMGSTAAQAVEAQGEAIGRLGHSVAADLTMLRGELYQQLGVLTAENAALRARIAVLERLNIWPWWRRWWWMLTGR